MGGTNSWSNKVMKYFQREGHFCEHITPYEILKMIAGGERNEHVHYYKPYPLYNLLKLFPEGLDFFIIEQSWLNFVNDSHVPVVYYHHEFPVECRCVNPTYLLMNLPIMGPHLNTHYVWWYHRIKERHYCWMAADPEEFNPNREKELKGINYVSCFESVMKDERDDFWKYVMDSYHDRWKEFAKNNGYIHTQGGETVGYEPYKDYMERSEAFLTFNCNCIYMSRRVLEAALCKSLNVIHIQNDDAEAFYNKIGFYNKKNCILFRNNDELKYIADQISNHNIYDVKSMVKDAYNLVLEKHTFKNRAKQILDMIL